jgi:hypothetical protein
MIDDGKTWDERRKQATTAVLTEDSEHEHEERHCIKKKRGT